MNLILSSTSASSVPVSLLIAASFTRLAHPQQYPAIAVIKLNHLSLSNSSCPPFRRSLYSMSWLGKLGLGFGNRAGMSSLDASSAAIAQGPDDDSPAPGQLFAQFGAGCFWGVELAFQRIPGVTKTEVGYSQGMMHNPTYEDVCTGTTNHSEVVRVQYDPNACRYEDLLDVFFARHDPTMFNRQLEVVIYAIWRLVSSLGHHISLKEGMIDMEDEVSRRKDNKGNDVGTQYRSGIYYYTPEQEKIAKESLERHQKTLDRKIVTEILPAKKFYRAEEYHQQYLEKGGRFGFKQSASKGCTDPIRCYG